MTETALRTIRELDGSLDPSEGVPASHRATSQACKPLGELDTPALRRSIDEMIDAHLKARAEKQRSLWGAVKAQVKAEMAGNPWWFIVPVVLGNARRSTTGTRRAFPIQAALERAWTASKKGEGQHADL